MPIAAATTVRVEMDVKDELDRIQGLVQAESGERLTHSQVLARLLRLARLHQAELLRGAAPSRPTAETVRARLAALAVRTGRTNVRALDKALYGDRP